MKNLFSRKRKINKGAPSGFVVSIIFHGAIFFVAGLFVVFKVMNPPKPEFEAPPPIERPRMKLKKPKVKVRKSSNPKPSSRIVAKVKTREMPEIQLPDLVGTGDGLLGGTGFGGDFLDLPEIGELSIFGSEVTTGNDLVGHFYDFNRTSAGNSKAITREDVDDILHKFMKRDWSESAFSRYYRSPKTLYTSCICIGTVQSYLAPEAFGEMDTEGWGWAVVYRGKLVYPEDIKFRFRGVGDKFNGVRVDGKVVLLCIYRPQVRDRFTDIWYSRDPEEWVYPMAESKQQVGDWIELKGGEPVDLEIIIGDRGGGLIYHQLVVEVEGEEYPRNPFGGGPRLPVFKTDNLSRAQIDAMYVDVYPGDVNLTNGPVFCDFFPTPVRYVDPPTNYPPPVLLKDQVRNLRTWTNAQGQSLEGRFLLQAEEYVLMEMADGRQQKVPYGQLSDEDKRFLELIDPPPFQIEYSKKSNQFLQKKFSPYDLRPRELTMLDYTYGAKLKWTGSKVCNHELTVEYFAIGSEVRGDSLILLDRRSMTFVPGTIQKRELEFYGKPIRVREYSNRSGYPTRGRRGEGGYLIVITDQQGRVVQYRASNEYLFENLEKLKRLPINAYFDEACERQWPTRPDASDRADWVLD